jgi:hypothetical protein
LQRAIGGGMSSFMDNDVTEVNEVQNHSRRIGSWPRREPERDFKGLAEAAGRPA